MRNKLLKQVVITLKAGGFDIVAPFKVQEYNIAQRGKPLPDHNRDSTLGLVIANSRELWPIFIQYLVSIDYQPDSVKDPLDRYTREQVESAFSPIPIHKEFVYPFESRRGVFYPFNFLAELSHIFTKDDSCYLGYNDQFGVWMGLRAAVILDMDFEEWESPFPLSHKTLGEGRKESKQLTEYLANNSNYAEDYMNDDVWRQWLCTRTKFQFQGKPYSWYQTAYHYSKNQKYLEGEIARYKNGTFCLDYNWIDDFNKDSMNYRRGEF